ncbi:hypothetical protein B0H15DRAFT_859209 [Mycena belliarum]|uniref:Uncharacterized protein n=1 Tax=Mycena belliarum TaxID=1033014 RepID=A0AAD6XLW1_9AGAR|nr:hypothetical protein B0H15DRAFT_859209 [Mycena belliae]
MPILRRLDSSTTHVSDSEPEREARCRACENSRSPESSAEASVPNSPPPHRLPLSAISNTVADTERRTRRTVDRRLSAIEGDLAEIKDKLEVLCGQKRNNMSLSSSPPSTPPSKRARTMRDQPVGPDTPVGRLEEPRIHRSSLMLSTPEREEMQRSLDDSMQQISAPHAILLRRPDGRQKTLVRRVH